MKDAFAGIIGHARAVERLERMLAQGSLPQALVFHGPRHVGKTALVSALASALLGTAQALKHPDLRWIARPRDEKTGKMKKMIPIEAVREAQEHLRMSALLGGAKIVLIEEADRLSEEASNALLKTLEEPAASSYIFLCVEDLAHLPKTILSRSAVFTLGRISDAVVAQALIARGVPPFEASQLVARADGRPGLALAFLQEKDVLDWYTSEERRWYALRLAPPHRRLSECATLAPARGDREEILARLHDLLDLWQGLLHRELKAGTSAAASNLRRLLALRASLEANVQPRLLLEKFVLTLEA